MMLGGTAGEVNPNSAWLSSRGMWLTYCTGVFVIHLALLSIPFLSVSWTWTLTNVIHNSAMFVFLHLLKGTPWASGDQGVTRTLTHWEQIDDGAQFTATRKFLTIFPIIMFFLTSFYTQYNSFHFCINFMSLISVTLPKLPMFHQVRIFGINKY